MRIITCGENSAVIEISTEVLGKMLGKNISSSGYATNPTYPVTLEGKRYDLMPMLNAIQEVRIAGETKIKVIEYLTEIQQRLNKAYFPIAEIIPCSKAKEEKK